jgi:probable F420-dependent oxidoreductase
VTTRKFRFGVQASTPRTAAQWAEQARKIEGLGYTTLLMPDHFADTAFAPMAALPFAAAATTNLRIGMLVLGNDYKHPAVVAKEAATLDVLSDGRLEFGLGAGWMTADYETLGLTYDRPGVRIDRLAEALAVVKGAWGDGPFDFSGEHYDITAYDGLPKPLQRPRPPILVGGGGAKVLRLAGREADIVGINPILHSGVIGAEAARDTVGDSTARKSVGCARARGRGSTRSSCRSATSWPRSPTIRETWRRRWHPGSGSPPMRRWARARCSPGQSTRCATRSSPAGSSGASPTWSSATTSTSTSRLSSPVSPEPDDCRVIHCPVVFAVRMSPDMNAI